MEDIMKIGIYLKGSGLVINGVSKTIKNLKKEEKQRWIF